MSLKLIKEYINNNKSTYKSKYKYHSCFQREENAYKFHYYMRDSQLQQINLFFEVKLTNPISITFTENIHDYEKKALAIEALEILERYVINPINLKYDEIKNYINGEVDRKITNQDVINILNYLKYHRGINQETIDSFYKIYLKYADQLLKNHEYRLFVESINMICDEILYEDFWIGININYMDQEYYLHLYYFRKLFDLCIVDFDLIYLRAKDAIEDLVVKLFKYDRFTFCMISVLDEVRCNQYIIDSLFSTLSLKFKLIEDDVKGNLPYSYLYSFYIGNEDMQAKYRHVIFENNVNDIYSIENHDMQIALGNYLMKNGGYDMLINLYRKQLNSFVFNYFPIEEIPESYHKEVSELLVDTIKHYATYMDVPEKRLGAFEQILNINRILMEHFRGEVYGY